MAGHPLPWFCGVGLGGNGTVYPCYCGLSKAQTQLSRPPCPQVNSLHATKGKEILNFAQRMMVEDEPRLIQHML